MQIVVWQRFHLVPSSLIDKWLSDKAGDGADRWYRMESLHGTEFYVALIIEIFAGATELCGSNGNVRPSRLTVKPTMEARRLFVICVLDVLLRNFDEPITPLELIWRPCGQDQHQDQDLARLEAVRCAYRYDDATVRKTVPSPKGGHGDAPFPIRASTCERNFNLNKTRTTFELFKLPLIYFVNGRISWGGKKDSGKFVVRL